MKRRRFIKTTAMAGLAVGLEGCYQKSKTHLLTLSFDDGFRKSFYRIAEIHEEYGLKACLNVIASGHLPSFIPPDIYQTVTLGNFNDWNTLKSRGHEIMPHSWEHLDLTEMPINLAREKITKCLEYFDEHLEGFRASDAVYNFAFNASTPELEQFALSKVRAIRTGGSHILGDQKSNPLPSVDGPFRLGCISYGPDNADGWVEEKVNQFMDSTGGWLILNLHGLDGEGWGPISTGYLDNLLNRMMKLDYLELLPAGEVLKHKN
ncbi:MAG: polysaccharide deacetylase family protein [Bacteroidota bacterium]